LNDPKDLYQLIKPAVSRQPSPAKARDALVGTTHALKTRAQAATVAA
jgi:hypothetical protein